jgi:hypothetical protein
MSETELQDAIIEAAGVGGWLVYHTHDSRRSAGGFPDLVLVRTRLRPLPGVTIFAELKREDTQPTLAQRDWLDALREAGNIVCLWRPSHLDAIDRLLLAHRSAFVNRDPGLIPGRW